MTRLKTRQGLDCGSRDHYTTSSRLRFARVSERGQKRPQGDVSVPFGDRKKTLNPGPTDLPRAGAVLVSEPCRRGPWPTEPLSSVRALGLDVPSRRSSVGSTRGVGSRLEAAPAWVAPRVPPRLRSRSTVRGSSEAGSAAVLPPKSRAGGSPFERAFRHREL